jgi:hypothetical protein
MADSESGLLERVFALKSIPELASLHPDDLLPLARVAKPEQWDGRSGRSDDETPCVRFVVEESLGPDADDATDRRVFCSVGLLEALAGIRPPALALDAPARGFSVARSALLEVIEEEFEVWRALLRCVCREALRRGISRWSTPAGVVSAAHDELLEIADRIELLRGVTPLREAGIHLLGQIAAEMEPIERDAGDLLWDAGEPARGAVLIVDGTVSNRSAAGAPVQLGPGTLLGLAESLAGEPHSYRVEATERLRALRIDTEALVDVLEDEPATAEELLCALAREVVQRRHCGAGERP